MAGHTLGHHFSCNRIKIILTFRRRPEDPGDVIVNGIFTEIDYGDKELLRNRNKELIIEDRLLQCTTQRMLNSVLAEPDLALDISSDDKFWSQHC